MLNDLWEGEEFSLAKLIQALSQALQEIDVDITQGSVRFLYEAFINLKEVSTDDFLRQYLIAPTTAPKLLPDTFAYQLSLRDDVENPMVRILIARSVSSNFPSALYVHLTSDYKTPGDIDQFVKQVIDDWDQSMAALNLKLDNAGGDDDLAN